MINKGRDMNEVGLVISLWKDLGKYRSYRRIIEPEDFFMHEAARVFYVIGLQMFEAGYKSIDKASVLSHVSKVTALENLFNKYGGYTTYEDMLPKVMEGNIEGYFANVQKAVFLNKLQDCGIDVQGNYTKLSQMNVEQIRRFYSFHLNNAAMNSTTNIVAEDLTITDEDYEYFETGAGMGFQFGEISPLMNYELLGIDKGLSFVGGMTNAGKTSYVMAIFIRAWMRAKIKTCIISNEQTIREFKRLLIAMVGYELFGDTGLSRRRIKAGKFIASEKEKFQKIMAYSNEHYGPLIKFFKIYDYSMDDVEIIIDTYSALGFEAYIYDVFKADDDTDKAVIGEMKKASKSLFKCADRNDVTIIATIQLGISFENVRFTGLSSISTSKQIVEPAHTAILLRTLWDDETTGSKYDIECWNYLYDKNGQKVPKGDGTFLRKVIEIEPGTERNYKLAFIPKTRNGEQDTVIVYKFLGDYNIWVELGYATKVHRKNRGVQK